MSGLIIGAVPGNTPRTCESGAETPTPCPRIATTRFQLLGEGQSPFVLCTRCAGVMERAIDSEGSHDIWSVTAIGGEP